MNIPTKVLRSTFITYETYYHHQQLAKRFYKSNKNNKKLVKIDGENKTFSEYEQFSCPELKQNFKEVLIKWYLK